MDWVTQIFAFGLLALALFIASLVFFRLKKSRAGLICGVLELVSGAISCAAWADALKVSGKRDWFLLGLLGYTPIALIFYAMIGCGLLCTVMNFVRIIKATDRACDNGRA